MAFTYDLAATGDDLVISRIRLQIGDSKFDKGPRPDSVNSNFSDEEILAFLAEEGSHKMRACAMAYETLATEWATYNGRHQLGPETREYKQQEGFEMRAKTMRERFGYTQTSETTGNFSSQIPLARIGDLG